MYDKDFIDVFIKAGAEYKKISPARFYEYQAELSDQKHEELTEEVYIASYFHYARLYNLIFLLLLTIVVSLAISSLAYVYFGISYFILFGGLFTLVSLISLIFCLFEIASSPMINYYRLYKKRKK